MICVCETTNNEVSTAPMPLTRARLHLINEMPPTYKMNVRAIVTTTSKPYYKYCNNNVY